MILRSLHHHMVDCDTLYRARSFGLTACICLQVSVDVRSSAESLLVTRQALSIDANAAAHEVRSPSVPSMSAKFAPVRCLSVTYQKLTLGLHYLHHHALQLR